MELSESQLHELEQLASKNRRSVDELVQLAVGDYLARRGDHSEWAKRLDQAVTQIRAAMPDDLTPDDIEADITAAWQEHRADRATRRRSTVAPDAGSH